MDLHRHINCPWPNVGKIRNVGNEPFWHCLYQPELLLDWLKSRWENRFGRGRIKELEAEVEELKSAIGNLHSAIRVDVT